MDNRRLMEEIESGINASGSSSEDLRSAVLSIAKELTKRDSQFNQKRDMIVREMKRGARIGKHRLVI
jgi:hypothetical protein